MDAQELLIPNYEEVILHIKDLIDFPTDFKYTISRIEDGNMSAVVSPTVRGEVLIFKLNYSENLTIYDLNRIYTRLGICMDKAETIVDGIDDVDILKRYIIMGVIHEFGHLHYMSLAYRYGAHRTFIASRSMNSQMFKAMEYESYMAMREDGYSPAYLLNPDELYADSFVKDHYDRIIDDLIKNKLI